MPRAPSWGFEAAGDDGTGVFVRLTLLPDASVAWYWAYLFVPDVGLVVVRDHEVPLPRRSTRDLEVRAEALWAELVCETPGEHWGIGLEAFGVVLDDPWDALRGELGIRVPVGLDLEWEHLAPEYREGDEREHQFGRVHGEILVGPERIPFDATGAREVTRGDLRVVPGRHHAAFASGDVFAVDFASGSGDGAPVTGYVWRLGDALAPVHRVLAEARPAEPAGPVALALRARRRARDRGGVRRACGGSADPWRVTDGDLVPAEDTRELRRRRPVGRRLLRDDFPGSPVG